MKIVYSLKDQGEDNMFYKRTDDNYIVGYEEQVEGSVDNIKDLIQIGDLVSYFNYSSQREKYSYLYNALDVYLVKAFPITKVYFQIEKGFRLVAQASHAYKNFYRNKIIIKEGDLFIV